MMERLDPQTLKLSGTAVIEASAGTGKTYTITSLVLRLLLERKLPIAQILVVTYTRAATAELRQRIRARLLTAHRIARGEQLDDPLCQALCEETRERLGQEELQDLLERALSDVDEAPVLTIHGFCQRTLSEHAFESGTGLNLEVTTCSAPIVAEITDDFFTRSLYSASPETVRPLLAEPDKLRTLAARSGTGDGLRILPEAIELSAFEKKSWELAHAQCVELFQEHRETIVALVAGLGAAASHALWASDWADALDAHTPGATLTLISDAGRKAFTRSGAAAKTKKGKLPPSHPFFDAAEDLVALDLAYKAQGTQNKIKFRRDFLHFLRAQMKARSLDHNVHTFDSLLTELHSALQGERAPALIAALQKRYRAALVDEFQDTDPLQYQIFRSLFEHEQGCLFLIGDPKQAIYGFRGADVHAYLSARADAGTRVYTLDTNRRSDPSLIDVLNRFYQSVHLPFALESIHYQPVRAPETMRDRFLAKDGHGVLDFLLLDGSGTASALLADTCSAVASDIARLLKSPCEIVGAEGTPQRVKPSDVAVLCRTNKQALSMQLALSQVGVVSVFQGDETVFRSEDAEAVERLLEALVYPTDPALLRSFLCSCYGGFTAEALLALDERDEGWEQHRGNFAMLHETFLQRGFMPAIRGLITRYQVEQRLLERPDGTRRITNLWHLIELLAAASIGQRLGPLGLLRWFRIVRLDESKRADLVGEDHEIRLESGENAVKLTTVHKSKGLEYPIVYCPFLWSADIPRNADKEFVRFHDPQHDFALTLDLGSEDKDAHEGLQAHETLAEGLRLLYVALTRAKHRICIALPDVKKSLPKSGLGYCLFGGDSAKAVEERYKALGADGLASHMQNLAERIGTGMGVRPEAAASRLEDAHAQAAFLDLKARPIKRGLDQARRVSSFSGLTAARSGAHIEIGRDHDAAARTQPTQLAERPALALDAFPKGAAAGELVHEVLEHADFQSSRADLEHTAHAVLAARGYDTSLAGILAHGLFNVLQTQLSPGLVLSAISRKSRVDEMEFVLPVTTALTPSALERAFREQRAPCALPSYAGALRELGFDKLTGFLRGFIDLVFAHEGRYFVVDYKSNWLGANADDYRPEALTGAMSEHHYFLQYHLYTVALHRHLALRVPDYNYELHFGGVYYLFLRGMAPDHPHQNGVFFDRPSHALVTSLERTLGVHARLDRTTPEPSL